MLPECFVHHYPTHFSHPPILYAKIGNFVPPQKYQFLKEKSNQKAIYPINRFSRLLQRLMVLLRVEALPMLFEGCRANVAQLRSIL
jgi:hypothetical protein